MRIESSATARDIGALEADILAAARQVLGQVAAFAAAHERATAAFKDRTGALRASIVRGQKGPWAQFVSVGGKAARYAIWIEAGSDPHEIRAKRRKALRFIQNGQVRFAKRVFHPGTKATRFVQTARDAAELEATRLITKGLNDVIRR